MERRWCERRPVDAEATLHFSGKDTKAKLVNVSLEGAFVEIGSELIDEDRCQIEFRMGDICTPCNVPAKVTHFDDHGLGLVFQFQSEDDFRKIRDVWMEDVVEKGVHSYKSAVKI